MNLENLNIRVKKYYNGWVVEILTKENVFFIFTRKKWKHLISVSGISSEPWYYKTKEIAISEAKRLFELDLLNS